MAAGILEGFDARKKELEALSVGDETPGCTTNRKHTEGHLEKGRVGKYMDSCWAMRIGKQSVRIIV